jgi:hypothetical protein
MTRYAPTLDAAAIGLSATCLVHCLLPPIAASAIPIAGLTPEAEHLHWALVGLAAPAAAIAFVRVPAEAKVQWTLRALAAIGVGLLIAGAAGWPDHASETPLTVAGALVLAAAHMANCRLRLRTRSTCGAGCRHDAGPLACRGGLAAISAEEAPGTHVERTPMR